MIWAKSIPLYCAALESTYLLTGAYILGVHEILTPCVIKQQFSTHCQVSHNFRINVLQCNKEFSSQPNEWKHCSLFLLVRYRWTRLLHMLSHELVGSNQQSFDSTFCEIISFSVPSFTPEYGLLVWSKLSKSGSIHMKRWWIRNSPAFVGEEFAPVWIAILVKRGRIVSFLCNRSITVAIVERYDSKTLTYSHAVFIRRL